MSVSGDKKLKITQLKLTETGAAQLDNLGLTLADLLCVIIFGRKIQDDSGQTYRFDVERVPGDVRAELRHLAGVELHVMSGAIVGATQQDLNETSGRDLPPVAGREREEEKR
jgi:hypothetical protein